jgi:hypothetical protein
LNAKLEREVAEIALKEYTEGAAVTERVVSEGELQLAMAGVEQARRNTAEARERLARIRPRLQQIPRRYPATGSK